MQEASQDKAFSWVLERIYEYSRWNSNPFRLPHNFGSSQLASNYKLRVNNILHYLQDEASVIKIIEEPWVPKDSAEPQPLRSLSELLEIKITPDNTPQTYLIETLPALKSYLAQTSTSAHEARLTLKGDSLCLEVASESIVIHDFQPESRPLKMVNHLLKNPNTKHHFKTVLLEADTAKSNDTPAEFVRHLEIKPASLRDKFFPVRVRPYIELQNPVLLTPEEYKKIPRPATVAKP